MGKTIPLKSGGSAEQVHHPAVFTPQQLLPHQQHQQHQQHQHQQVPFLGSVQQAPPQPAPLQGTTLSCQPPPLQFQQPQKYSLHDDFSEQQYAAQRPDPQHQQPCLAQDALQYQQNQPLGDSGHSLEWTQEHQQYQQQQQLQQQQLQQQQLQQQQQQQLHNEQSFHQAQSLHLQQAAAQEPPQYPHNQPLSACQQPAYQEDHHPNGGPGGRGGGGSVSLSPAKFDFPLSLVDNISLSAVVSQEPLGVKRRRVDPAVATFPKRDRLEGDCHFRVEIPGTGRKLLVSPDEGGEGRRINTEMGHMMTLELTHTAESSAASFRFLLVYSKDAEASTPVVPCGNHRREEHPRHMLEVKVGEREATLEWEEEPHPSVLLTPTVLAPGRFTCQLAFLCRNSCITRRDLTLLCQLEVGGRVAAREPFKVKVSACPRRDAGAPTRRPAPLGTPSPTLTGTLPRPQPPAIDPEVSVPMGDMLKEAAQEAERQGRRTAFLTFLERYVQERLPDQYKEAWDMFCHWKE